MSRFRRIAAAAAVTGLAVLTGAGVARAATANTLPAHRSASATATTITATWSASSTAHAGITTYHVQLAVANSGAIAGDARTTGLTETFTGLTPSTRYQWRIAAGQDPWHLASPWSAWSANVWTQASASLPPPPPPPAVIGSAPAELPLPMGTCGQAGSQAPPNCIPLTDYGAQVTNLTGAQLAADWDPDQTEFDGGTPAGSNQCGTQCDGITAGTISTDQYGNALLTTTGADRNEAQLSSGNLTETAGTTYLYGIFTTSFYVSDVNGKMANWPAWWAAQPGCTPAASARCWPTGGEIDALEDIHPAIAAEEARRLQQGCLRRRVHSVRRPPR